MRSLSYRARMRWLLVLGVVSALAVNLVIWKLASLYGMPDKFWVTFPLILLGFGAVFAFAIPYWIRLDDVQKQGQLSSWYWGGMAGAVTMLAWLVGMDVHRTAFGIGAGLMLLAQSVGFAIAWVVWGLRGRGPVE